MRTHLQNHNKSRPPQTQMNELTNFKILANDWNSCRKQLMYHCKAWLTIEENVEPPKITLQKKKDFVHEHCRQLLGHRKSYREQLTNRSKPWSTIKNHGKPAKVTLQK